MTGHTFREIDEDWDLPRLAAWNKLMGGLPPLAVIVGRYIGYKAPDEATSSNRERETMEQAAARLMKSFGVG